MLFGRTMYDDDNTRKLHDIETLNTLFSNIDIDCVKKI